MISLRGIEVERLAYLGGEDYLVLPGVLPCPVQLPNCIAKSIKYLRQIGECSFRLIFLFIRSSFLSHVLFRCHNGTY
jgi:hypothetical protein